MKRRRQTMVVDLGRCIWLATLFLFSQVARGRRISSLPMSRTRRRQLGPSRRGRVLQALEAREPESLLNILLETWNDVTANAHTESVVSKCRMPGTDQVVDFCQSDEGKGMGKSGKQPMSKTSFKVMGCSPSPGVGQSASLKNTSSPTRKPSKDQSDRAKKDGKDKGEIENKRGMDKGEKERKDEDDDEGANVKSIKDKGEKEKSEKREKGKEDKDDKEKKEKKELRAVAEVKSIKEKAKNTGKMGKKEKGKMKMMMNGKGYTDPALPVCPTENSERCAALADGSANTNGRTGQSFRIEMTAFAESTSLSREQRDMLQIFVDQGVVLLVGGCDADLSSLLESSRRSRRLQQDELIAVDVGSPSVLDSGFGPVCGSSAPSPGSRCFALAMEMEAFTNGDGSSLSSFASDMSDTLSDSLSPDILNALGLSGVSGISVRETDEIGNNPQPAPAPAPGQTPGGSPSRDAPDDSAPTRAPTLGGTDPSTPSTPSTPSAPFAPSVTLSPTTVVIFDSIQTQDIVQVKLAPGPIIAIAAAGMALIAILVVAFRKRRYPSLAAALKHYQMTDDEFDDDESSLFLDEISESTPGKKVRYAHVLGETDSTFTGTSWQGQRSVEVKRVYSTPVDENGFPAPISISQDGDPIFEKEQHGPHETCSSPNCEICERRRQGGKSIKFVNVHGDLNPKPRSLPSQRSYLATDTVQL